jgi:1-acyl-sn-glycerol-3-phosphate acyltransferase
MLRATLTYLFMGLFIVLLAIPAMLWVFVSKNDALLYKLARFSFCVAAWICGIRVSMQGQEKIKPDATYVFLSNHQGNFDGPVLIYSVRRNLKALIKMEMMQLPVLAQILRQAQFVPIERANPKNAHLGIEHGARLLAEGKSFFAFPEGTRSRNGNLGEFKKGVFIMAIKAQVPIMPITIIGSSAVQPPGSYAISPGVIQVIFHDPISTTGMTLDDRNRLIQLTRDAIASQVVQSSAAGGDATL